MPAINEDMLWEAYDSLPSIPEKVMCLRTWMAQCETTLRDPKTSIAVKARCRMVLKRCKEEIAKLGGQTL